MNLASLFSVLLSTTSPVAYADPDTVQRISQDCYQEWQSRGWKLGRNLYAENLEHFRRGIEVMCEARAELRAEGVELSTYIEHSLPDVAPYAMRADKAMIKQRLREIAEAGNPNPRIRFMKP